VRDVEARLAALPGVEAVGAVESLPLSGFDGDVTFNLDGRAPPEAGEESTTWMRPATPGYRAAAGLRLVAGRWVDERDVREAPRVVVINETLAERHFTGENPIGRLIYFGGNPDADRWEVIGVAADTRHFSVRDDRREAVYVSYDQVSPTGLFFALRVPEGRDPLALLPDARRAVGAVDQALALRRVRTMDDVVGQALAADRFLAVLLSSFAVVTLVLAVVGLYGVISYTVGARLREMGVRMALGAEAGRIGRMVVGRSLVLSGVGVAVGLLLAVASARALGSLLYGVRAVDPVTFALTSALLMAVAVLASVIPAARAARVDPIEVLRSD
jgi:predicted permease